MRRLERGVNQHGLNFKYASDDGRSGHPQPPRRAAPKWYRLARTLEVATTALDAPRI